MNVVEFFQEDGLVDWFDTPKTIYHCLYDSSRYRDELFEHHNVSYSDTLNRSVVKRRAEYLAGRYCAAKSLQQLGIHSFRVNSCKNRSPIWPEGIVGSISHNNNHAVAVTSNVATLCGIGIDIESLVQLETVDNIQGQIIDDSEREIIASARKQLLFTLIFSIKESFFKAAYPSVKRYFDFHEVTVSKIDLTARTIDFSLNNTLCDTLKKGMSFRGKFYVINNDNVVTLLEINV